MNKKGFTLIELLAVIVVLGLVLIISVPNLTDVYKNSKLKTEEIFIDKLSKRIEEYIDFNKDTWSFENEDGTRNKKVPNSGLTKVTVWKEDISFQELLNSKLVTKGDFIDPNTKKNCSEGNGTTEGKGIIEVYKDTDYVYCFVVRKKSFNIEETSCLSDDYLNKYTKGDESQIINTCPWD